ncbi:hypothetical protein [Daejeonella sp.]|uniref:beta strand repeat-containing protein n=1 Tax=Daejeonella sp. TaxID=2805397 RepID=UPI0027B8DCE3|nr:hypothetical protein [Daejeonella sp.]
MRPIKLLSIALMLTGICFLGKATAQIKIGTNGAIIAPASLLELESANQGFLLPRMANTIAIDALNPPNGMMIYKTTDPAGLYIRKNNQWEYITGSMNGDAIFNSLTVNGPVTALSFSGPLTGNASTATLATTATNSNNSAVINDIANPGTTYPVFVNSTPGNQPLRTSSGNLSYVPATGILTAKGFNGLLTGDVIGNASSSIDAQNTVNIRITDDVIAPATMFPTFVPANSGPLAPRVASTKLSFIPLTGELTTTTFRGALIGNASSATNVTGNVAAVNGGTGHSIYSPGDMLYASTSSALVKLPIGAPGTVLRVSSGNLPSWSTAGAGTVTSVSGTNNRITVSNPSVAPIIDISPNYIGQTSINTLGTITTGVWNGSVIPVASGGTGLASLPTSLLAGDGTNSISKVTGPLGYVLTSTGETTLPVFKASGGGDMILASTQTVTGNKTFTDGTLRLNGSSGGVTTLVANSNSSSTVELPPNGIIVNRDRLETLLNKTLTDPILNGTPNLGSAIGTKLNISGNVTAGTFTGPLTGNVTGNASTATAFTNPLAGDVTGNQTSTTVKFVDGIDAATIRLGAQKANAGTAVNTPNTLVARDNNGNFVAYQIVANQITALETTGFIGNLSGNAATVTTVPSLSGDVTSAGNAITVKQINGTALSGLATGILKNTTATGVPSIAVAADFPLLNQNTTGNAATVTTVPSLSGDVTSAGNAITVKQINGTALSGLATGILKNTTTTGVPSIALAADFPILNQNTTGNAANVTEIILGANGGTGVANTGKTITLSANLATTGSAITLNSALGSTVSLPTTGTLYGTKDGSISSSTLAGSLTDESGSGSVVYSNSPNLVAPSVTSLIGNGTTPSFSNDASINTVSIDGTDLAGRITLTSTNGILAEAIIITIDYAGPDYLNASYPILTPGNAKAASLADLNQVHAVGSVGNFVIRAGQALPTGVYVWNYHVIGR